MNHALCLIISQLSLMLIALTYGGMAGLSVPGLKWLFYVPK